MFIGRNGLMLNGYDKRAGAPATLAQKKGSTSPNWASINMEGYPFNKESKMCTVLEASDSVAIDFGMVLGNGSSVAKKGRLFREGIVIETIDDRITMLKWMISALKSAEAVASRRDLRHMELLKASIGGSAPIWVSCCFGGTIFVSGLGVFSDEGRGLSDTEYNRVEAAIAKYMKSVNNEKVSVKDMMKNFNMRSCDKVFSGVPDLPINTKSCARLVSLMGVLTQIKSMNSAYSWVEMNHDVASILDAIVDNPSVGDTDVLPLDFAYSLVDLVRDNLGKITDREAEVLNRNIGVPFCKASLLAKDGRGALLNASVLQLVMTQGISKQETSSTISFTQGDSVVVFSGEFAMALKELLAVMHPSRMAKIAYSILAYARLVGKLSGNTEVWALATYLRWVGVQGVTASTFVSAK